MSRISALLLSLLLAACSGSGDGGGGPTPPPVVEPKAPTVVTQPVSVSAPLAGATTLTAGVAGDFPLTYQWFRDGVPLAGSTAPTFNVPVVNLSDGGVYTLYAANAVGSTTSLPATVTVAGAPPASDLAASAPRVILSSRATGGLVKFPAPSESWQVTYSFVVPVLPTPFNKFTDSFYIWGDIEFDAAYGPLSPYKLSNYKFNQLVPQLMIGNVVGGHNPVTYTIIGKQFQTWVIQAQYFWQKDDTPYALTGAVVAVNPGETINETISYDATTKKITASISGPGGTSTIVIDKPFPNEPALFADWHDYFTQAAALSGGQLYAQPILSVEPNTTKQTLCSVLPFTIKAALAPTIANREGFSARPVSLPCTGIVKF